MISTIAGIPAGYGYFEKTATVNQDIMPDVVAHIKASDPNAAPIAIQTMTIQVEAEAKVSINGRAPVLVQPDIGLSFDVRGGVTSLSFDTAVAFNIAFSY